MPYLIIIKNTSPKAKISECADDSKQLNNLINNLMTKSDDNPLPTAKSDRSWPPHSLNSSKIKS